MGQNTYFKNDIRTARGETLVQRLLEKAIRQARAAAEIGAQDVAGRSAKLRSVFDIVTELQRSLDHERGGEIAANLNALYDFVSSRIALACTASGDEFIGEALRVLEILHEAWVEMSVAAPESADVGVVRGAA